MKKIVIVVVVLVGLGIAWWLGAPLFIDKKVSETVEDIKTSAPVGAEQIVIAEGSFIGADDFHNGEGTAKLIKAGEKHFVRFEDDFKVTNGPDLFVHFGRDGKYVAGARIGGLKGNIGGQNYEVPDSINPEDYNEVWIWCRAFSVPFAHAVFN